MKTQKQEEVLNFSQEFELWEFFEGVKRGAVLAKVFQADHCILFSWLKSKYEWMFSYHLLFPALSALYSIWVNWKIQNIPWALVRIALYNQSVLLKGRAGASLSSALDKIHFQRPIADDVILLNQPWHDLFKHKQTPYLCILNLPVRPR